MGKIKRGILGGFSGKVANVIGGSWKGIAYMRAQPLSVSQPNTAAQQTQKNTFSQIVEDAKAFLTGIIQPLWNRLAVQMSGYNQFIKSNIGFYDDTGLAQPQNLLIAIGPDTGAVVTNVTGAAGQPDVVLEWVDNSGTGTALATDEAYALALNTTQDNGAIASATAVRSDTQITVSLPTDIAQNDNIWCYLAFKSADGLKISGTERFEYDVP